MFYKFLSKGIGLNGTDVKLADVHRLTKATKGDRIFLFIMECLVSKMGNLGKFMRILANNTLLPDLNVMILQG